MKYEIGRIPAELTTATAVAQAHFLPRIWSAGLRLMSMSAAILRLTSTAAAARSSLRLLSLRSLHCLLAAMASSACTAGVLAGLHLTWVTGPPPTSAARGRIPAASQAPPGRPPPGARRRPALGHHE